ncbi:Hypothetical protein A7982_10213 [Minicystis rosea]|nr:Hypothetical protein A7982_10213 [Minicystis rosea]
MARVRGRLRTAIALRPVDVPRSPEAFASARRHRFAARPTTGGDSFDPERPLGSPEAAGRADGHRTVRATLAKRTSPMN